MHDSVPPNPARPRPAFRVFGLLLALAFAAGLQAAESERPTGKADAPATAPAAPPPASAPGGAEPAKAPPTPNKPLFKAGATKAEKLSDAHRKMLFAQSWADKVVVVELHAPILGKPMGSADTQIIAALDKAETDKAQALVIDMDSPGGEVGACDRIVRRLLSAKLPTTALVTHKAVSGGAMVALACKEVLMTPGARIGDIQPMQMDPSTGGYKEMDPASREKIEADVRAQMKVIGSARKRPVPVLEAMVTASIELTRVDFGGGKHEYLTKEELALLERNLKDNLDSRKVVNRELVSPAGKLVHLAPEEAVRYGVADKVVADRDAFLAERGWGDPNQRIMLPVEEGGLSLDLKWLFPEDLPGWASVLLVLFLVVTVAGFYLEMQTPGVGIPGTAACISLVGFFAILMMHDRGSWFGVILFIIGAGLLLVEILLIPGFGVTGVAGIICIAAGLFLAYLPDLDWSAAPAREYLGGRVFHELGNFVVMVFLALVGGGLVAWLLASYGGRLPGFQGLLMTKTLASGKESLAESRRAQGLAPDAPPAGAEWIGRRGRAKTLLRPAGKVVLDGDGVLLDVVTTGEWLEVGAPVTVVEARDWHIVVRPVAPVADGGTAERS